MAEAPHVLLIEDDPAFTLALRDYLTFMGFRVTVATAGAPDSAVDLIVSDYRLPAGAKGTDVVRDARAHAGRTIPAIVLTGDVTGDAARDVAALETTKLLLKPVRMDVLVNEIRALLSAGA